MDQCVVSEGWIQEVEHCKSPHFSERNIDTSIDLLVIHNISLPPNQYGGSYISDLFMGCLNADADPFFREIEGLEVSAHCLVRRDGQIIQYVSFDNQAWHAGVSSFCGRERCNQFSIGIELEGSDFEPFTSSQYQSLTALTVAIQQQYPAIVKSNIVGHSDIAPGRKTDPGPFFEWSRYFDLMEKHS